MRTLALLLAAVSWASPVKHPARPKPKAAPILLRLGDVVSLGGTLYTVTSGTALILVPAPAPVPIPVPVPTPVPSPAPFIGGYRDGNRNPATIFSPGSTVFIDGSNFGPPAGTVTVNNTVCKVYAWTDTEIAITAPPLSSYPAGPVLLSIFTLDKRSVGEYPAFTLR